MTLIENLMQYLNQSLTAFHAVQSTKDRLDQAGFQEYSEKDIWHTAPGNQGYVIRNQSGILAFRIGSRPAEGFRIITAHTDSPCMKIKWNGANTDFGFLRLPVEIYGAPIRSTWLDKPLTIAGRYTEWKNGKVQQKLIQSIPGQATIPNLAIHMNRNINKGIEYNPQTHMTAFCGENTLTGLLESMGVPAPDNCHPDQLECFLVDATPAVFLGTHQEWFQSPRLDNLASCFGALQALLDAETSPEFTQIIFLADNEEIGNQSAAGADSMFLRDSLCRLLPEDLHPRQGFFAALSQSRILSADAAHASHPSYPESFDTSYTCRLNAGPVIKSNGCLRYSTNAESQTFFRAVCRENNIPLQDFQVRSDSSCGTTVGPISSSMLGVSATDIGVPMWSMHSARETAGVQDQIWFRDALKLFLNH